MSSESDISQYRGYALSISAKWDYEMLQSVFASEYADRRCFEDDNNVLRSQVRILGGRIGALKRRLRALQAKGGAR